MRQFIAILERKITTTERRGIAVTIEDDTLPEDKLYDAIFEQAQKNAHLFLPNREGKPKKSKFKLKQVLKNEIYIKK